MRLLKQNPIPLSLVLALLLMSGSVFAQTETSVPTIAVYPDIYYAGTETLYLEGRAAPDATIQIRFEKPGSKPMKFNTKSDSGGEWVFAEEVMMDSGNWEVRVGSISNSGISSDWSNPRVIKTVVTAVALGGVSIRYSFLWSLVFIIVSVAAITAIYYFFRVRFFKNRVQSEKIKFLEKQLAIHELEEGFGNLKRNIIEELEHLDKKTNQGGG